MMSFLPIRPSAPQQLLLAPRFLSPVSPLRQLTALPGFWSRSTGSRPIAGTYATLTIDGPQFGGFDGCNYFGGRHESGSLVVKQNGEISLPPSPRTAQGCADPPGNPRSGEPVSGCHATPGQSPCRGRPAVCNRPFGRGRAGFRKANAIGRTTHGLGGYQLAARGRRGPTVKELQPFCFWTPGRRPAPPPAAITP